MGAKASKKERSSTLGKNLVKNPYALDEYEGWEKDVSADFTIESCFPEPPAGANRLEIPDWNGGEIKAWVASYMWCSMTQMINLREEGLSVQTLDVETPDIIISEWYAGRSDCGCTFALEVELLGEDKSTVIDNFSGEWTVEQGQGKEWHLVSHIFSVNKPGVRYIKYTHKGKDTQFWQGHYGPKFTGALVRFHFKK